MDHRFPFSIFTIEINGRPTLALQTKRHKDAEPRGLMNGFPGT
jgi:hypothetical protein